MGMPFWMCAGSRVAFLVSAACAGVIFWYVLIAVEWFRPIIRRGLVEPELKVLSSLVAVFLACSFCGYGFRIASNWYPNYWLLLAQLTDVPEERRGAAPRVAGDRPRTSSGAAHPVDALALTGGRRSLYCAA